MVLIQAIDKKKFNDQPRYYQGGNIGRVIPFKSLNNREIFLSKDGGFINLSSIIDAIKDNKDLITAGISTVGNISNAVKAVSDTVKTAKELDKLKEVKELKQKNSKKKKEIQLSEAQIESIKNLATSNNAKLGEGFARF